MHLARVGLQLLVRDAARCFMSDARAAIAPTAALVLVVLVIAAGMGIDIGRQVQLYTALQDTADAAALAGITQSGSANAVASATAYVNAAAARLAGTPTVSATYAYDNTTNASVPTMTVKLSASLPTTLLSIVTSSLNASVTAVASGSLARKVTVSVTNFNSSASDLDQIYYYTYPSSLSGTALYQYVPTLTSSSVILSNSPTNKLTGSTTFTVPLGYSVGFALGNTTGGNASYGANCYGQAAGSTVYYYSHRESSDGLYYDFPSVAFNSCGYTKVSSNLLSNCTGLLKLLCTSVKFPAGNYIYATGYSRNPLQFTTSNTDCSAGNVGYAWDDNGGPTDDDDFNDANFTVNCSDTTVSNATVKLIN